jgi:transcriptional regulator with XRE-family HTH domain
VTGPSLGNVDTRSEIREFLTSRRGRITPEQAGLPTSRGVRRVPGLRREEAARLAGLSVDHYARLERGNLAGVPENVLNALARALRLDDTDRARLFDLALAADKAPRVRRRRASPVRPGVQRLLDAMTGAAAFVLNGRVDILATNELGRALYSEMFTDPVRPANLARFLFLNPRSADFWPEWSRAANDAVALLRAEAGRNAHDRALSDLIGRLSTLSEEFRVRWAADNVRSRGSGVKRMRHPRVGDLTLSWETLDLAADPGLTVLAYTAEPGTTSHDALNRLASAVPGTPRTSGC